MDHGGGGVPVIDLQNFPEEAEKLIRACEEWGCFRVINHGVPAGLMGEIKLVAESLHELPPATKRRNGTDIFEGYIPPSNVNPFFEGLGFYDTAGNGGPVVDDFCSRLDASSQQRETIKKYFQATHELALDIGKKLAESLGLGSDLCNGWACQFWLNKYHFTPQTLGETGVRIHTDLGFLTILQEDDKVGGLELAAKDSGEFMAVDPLPGSLFINLGDLAKVWSNGRLHNVKHRVQCKEPSTRFSITLFVVGPMEEAVQAPPEMVDSGHPALYRPFTFEEYRKIRLSTGLKNGEALEFFRAAAN
ncbi:2-oxoglutarate-dependent dioxygenase DAO-like [Diospyros lotus]|uniref:2-oxoglutarate-dependent dioxygenase DAO-like n=1 Tax=Diospyros lotus TaxID=55363 RepID=UPI002250DF5E|nr:2-oxoglutarate-dependent dioxygenase DAO-like [Diospyros lotus]